MSEEFQIIVDESFYVEQLDFCEEHSDATSDDSSTHASRQGD